MKLLKFKKLSKNFVILSSSFFAVTLFAANDTSDEVWYLSGVNSSNRLEIKSKIEKLSSVKSADINPKSGELVIHRAGGASVIGTSSLQMALSGIAGVNIDETKRNPEYIKPSKTYQDREDEVNSDINKAPEDVQIPSMAKPPSKKY